MLVWTTAGSYPERPASEVEWEDLLVRLEIGPRAFRIAAADLNGDAIDRLLEVAHASMMHEMGLSAVLDAMRGGTNAPSSAGAVWEKSEQGDALSSTLDRWAALRSRNFAMVQRRGLGVWDWAAEGGILGTQRVTAHQALLATLAFDAQALAMAHEAGRRNR